MKYGRKRKNISIQFIIFMNNNSICEEFQSGFCTFHSPETTLIKAETMIYCLLPTPGLFHTCPPHLWCPSRINFRSSFFLTFTYCLWANTTFLVLIHNYTTSSTVPLQSDPLSSNIREVRSLSGCYIWLQPIIWQPSIRGGTIILQRRTIAQIK